MNVSHSHDVKQHSTQVSNIPDVNAVNWAIRVYLDGTHIYMSQAEAIWLSAALSAACADNEKVPIPANTHYMYGPDFQVLSSHNHE